MKGSKTADQKRSVNGDEPAKTLAALAFSGDQARWFYFVAGAMLVVSLVSSGIVGAIDVRSNPGISATQIWIGEATSHLAIFLLLPLFPIILERIGTPPPDWRTATARLVLGFGAFWIGHVALMFASRLTLFPIFTGRGYNVNLFAPAHLSYEFSKDIFTFALLTFGFFVIRAIVARSRAAAAAQSGGRLALKSGATTHLVSAEDIVFASAAANYVEVKLAERTILARLSLSRLCALAESRGEDLVRVHRSYAVNKTKIKTVAARGDGGLRILLDDGSEIPCSRGYRNAVTEFLA